MKNLLTKSGIADEEWIRTNVSEARVDPVGMWSMVNSGRSAFGLTGSELEKFVHYFIVEMIKAGALPITGNKAAPFGWSPVLKYGKEPVEVADALLKEWLSSKVDPDVGGIWFAFPAVWM